MLGTKLHGLLWRARWFHESGMCGDCDSHRAFLVERVGRFAPFESVLEVGCGAGGNLIALSRAYPGTRLYGVDISARAVTAAETLLAREAIANITIYKNRADNLRCFSDRSIDIVLTDATLMYVGPDKIGRVMSELARVARKGWVLNEWHLFERNSPGSAACWYYAHWVHDYTQVAGNAPAVKAVRVERLPAGLWGPGGGWEIYGAVVEVEL